MIAPRLKTQLRVQAALREASTRGSFGAVVRRGDGDSGGILVLLRARDGGSALLSETRNAEGEAAWLRRRQADGAATEAAVSRALERDPDLWVVEFDADDLEPPFTARLLAD